MGSNIHGNKLIEAGTHIVTNGLHNIGHHLQKMSDAAHHLKKIGENVNAQKVFHAVHELGSRVNHHLANEASKHFPSAKKSKIEEGSKKIKEAKEHVGILRKEHSKQPHS